MRDVKKTLKNIKNKNNKKMFTENPFIIAIIVFSAAFLINFLLELNFTKNLFNWCAYYFNSTLYQLNSFLQPTFKNHPFIKMPLLTNPVTAEFMGIINPWMWLRGFIIGSFTMGQIITILQVKTIKPKNIVLAAVLIGILQLGLYAMPYNTMFSLPVFVFVIQKFYINILALMFICFIGLLFGTEYSIYLFRNEKINVSSKTDGPNIQVKYTDKLDW